MEAYLTQISNYLLRQSWQIATLVVVLAAVSWLLRNRSAHIRYLLWLIVLAKCLVPPLTTIPLAILPQESVPERALMLPTYEPIITSENVIDVEPPAHRLAPAPRPSREIATERVIRLTIRQGLGAAWIAGMIIFALIAVIKALRTELWLRQQRKLLPVRLQGQIEDIFSGLNLKTFPEVWLLDDVGQPFVWGFLRGGIYLPSDFKKVNSFEQQRGILGHELSHILRFDAAVNLLQMVAQGMFWFHPFVWWANKKIRAEREKCCDEITIARLGAKTKEYSKAIVNILISEHKSTRPVPSLAVAGPVKNIEERIKTMLRPGKIFYKRPSLIAATIVLLFALLTVPIGCVLTNRVETETSIDFNEEPTNPLHQAAKDGDLAQVRKLIAAGADVNADKKPWPRKGIKPLYEAAKYGHKDIAELLIAKGADIDAKDELGDTPLQKAAENGHSGVAELLIAKGADVNAINENLRTPLYIAAERGHLDITKLLIAEGADVNIKADNDNTPLHRAVMGSSENKKEIVELLISKGADVNARLQGDGRTPLYTASQRGRKEVVEFLIDKGADVDPQVLEVAVLKGNSEVVEFLLTKGVTAPPLHLSAFRGDLGKVRSLLEQGKAVDERDASDRTPLYWALCTEQTEVAKLLIAKGANVNAKDDGGKTILVKAVHEGNRDLAELLIAKGADVNVPYGRGTALHYAGDPDIARLLISKGADVNMKGWRGRTPLFYLGKEAAELLIAKGADVNAKDEWGWTPLLRNCYSGRKSRTEFLIDNGADVNAKNNKGQTPLWLAKYRGRDEIIELLLKHGAKE